MSEFKNINQVNVVGAFQGWKLLVHLTNRILKVVLNSALFSHGHIVILDFRMYEKYKGKRRNQDISGFRPKHNCVGYLKLLAAFLRS